MTRIYEALYAQTIPTKLNYCMPNQNFSYHDKSCLNEVDVMLYNARHKDTNLNPSDCGFRLLYAPQLEAEVLSAKISFSRLYERARELIAHLNFNNALHFGTAVRSSHCQQTPETNDPNRIRPVANFVHADWGPSRLKRLGVAQDSIINLSQATTESIADFMKANPNWYIFNVWIPLGLVTNNALALCSRQTVCTKACFEVNFKSLNSRQSSVQSESENDNAPILSMAPDSNHQWYYFPLMQPGEVLLFYQASAASMGESPVMHSNVELPIAVSHPRTSMELRFLLA